VEKIHQNIEEAKMNCSGLAKRLNFGACPTRKGKIVAVGGDKDAL
jgi:hypothetical protein